MATSMGMRLPFIIFPVSSTMQNSRSPGTPRSVSVTRSRSSIASALTGATWIQATRAYTSPLSVHTRSVRIWTVGHGTRSIDELIAVLRESGIATLTDVRTYPGSRRHPQFGQAAIRGSLEAHGIGYVHLPGLGG